MEIGHGRDYLYQPQGKPITSSQAIALTLNFMFYFKFFWGSIFGGNLPRGLTSQKASLNLDISNKLLLTRTRLIRKKISSQQSKSIENICWAELLEWVGERGPVGLNGLCPILRSEI